MGAVALLLNIPLFVLGWHQGGGLFMLKTLIATVLLSLFIDYAPVPWTIAGQGGGDMLLAAIYGGLLLGLGMGLVFRSGATTGGTDLVASMVHKRLPGVRIAWVLFAIDICVVTAGFWVTDARVALYSLGALFLSAKVTDFVQVGFNESKVNYIITDQGDLVMHRLMDKLERGVTVAGGSGRLYGAGQIRPILRDFRPGSDTAKGVGSRGVIPMPLSLSPALPK